jgi:hypothetical protein
MSASMSFLGGLCGQAVEFLETGNGFDLAGLAETWRFIWPRNFCVAFWIEMLVAQPAARMAMTAIHKRKLSGMAAGGA